MEIHLHAEAFPPSCPVCLGKMLTSSFGDDCLVPPAAFLRSTTLELFHCPVQNFHKFLTFWSKPGPKHAVSWHWNKLMAISQNWCRQSKLPRGAQPYDPHCVNSIALDGRHAANSATLPLKQSCSMTPQTFLLFRKWPSKLLIA